MPEIWDASFREKQLMWGRDPARSALFASELFQRAGVRTVLLAGVGYGRNATPFLDAGMSVTGIEISATAISLARSELHLDFPIHHGSVTEMPFDEQAYDAVFCYGLLYLLDAASREKLLHDCYRQLSPGGLMIFTVVAKEAPMYKRGVQLGEDWYEVHPGVSIYFYDAASIAYEFAPLGLVEQLPMAEPHGAGASWPFINIVCRKCDPPGAGGISPP